MRIAFLGVLRIGIIRQWGDLPPLRTVEPPRIVQVEFTVVANFLRQEETGIDTCGMKAESAIDVKQVTGIVILFKAKAGHVSELSQLVAETAVSRIGIIAVAVIVACSGVFGVGLRGGGIVLEIVETMIDMQGSLYPTLNLRVPI